MPPNSSNVQVFAPRRKSPSRTITDGVHWPVGIGVDANGTLYVTNYNAPCNIEEYRAGSSHPFKQIRDELLGPVDVAFNKGRWFYVVDSPTEGCGYGSAAILEFRLGSVKPSSRKITKDLHYPQSIAYYPPLLP